jgi:hypothetical protein
MTQEQFESHLRELFMPKDGDPEYEKHEMEALNLVGAAVQDTIQFSGGKWSEEAALERMPQWEWARSQMTEL